MKAFATRPGEGSLDRTVGGGGPIPRPAPQPPVESGLRVIVVGAGISGLRAAAVLERAGAQVTVLESRDRIGGRIHTGQLGRPGPQR